MGQAAGPLLGEVGARKAAPRPRGFAFVSSSPYTGRRHPKFYHPDLDCSLFLRKKPNQS